ENFPTLAWHFQIEMHPDTVFVLPYHEYLTWVNQEKGTERDKKLRLLEEVAVSIEESTLIPHFKYVSMHLSHDRCIYLLYLFKKSLKKMREHKVVKSTVLNDIESKVDKLLMIAWRERGKYPGFKNVLRVILRSDFDTENLENLCLIIENLIVQNFGNITEFLDGEHNLESASIHSTPKDVRKAIKIIERKKGLVAFLSLFDFSIKQFERIIEVINNIGLKSMERNPYILLENYPYDTEDHWDIEKSDYGIGLYQIDIALIPDPKYAGWETYYDVSARSPERIRAIITKILRDAALNEGHSYLTRKDIIKRIEEYPLYYIGEKLKVDVYELEEYEKQPIFREKFIIRENLVNEQTIYQLREVREIENIIEIFINKMLRKKYGLSEKDKDGVEKIIQEEQKVFGEKLDLEERRKLYLNTLSNGLSIISGKAGSGKTQAIVNLISKFKKDGKLIFVFTPTGKANLVIRNRLKKLNLHKEKKIRISTIHRFLYVMLLEEYGEIFSKYRTEIFRLTWLVSRILSGKLEMLSEFKTLANRWQFGPDVLIIDEASMVDEVLLSLLFSLINPEKLEHLILVGDERQLPPIGVGRPFVDIIFHLKKKSLEANYIRLETNLRFEPTARLGILSELFSAEENPSLMEIEECLNGSDSSLEVHFFSNIEDLKNIIRRILVQISGHDIGEPIFDMFSNLFEKWGLERIQIITPRRVGNFGSMALNTRVIMNEKTEFLPGTKLICEENIYTDIKSERRSKRVLGLANGSIGCITKDGSIYFDDLFELAEVYGWESIKDLVYIIKREISASLIERRIDFGYAITIHKSQGSDFDHVILVLSDVSRFITRELLYTAFTRPKEKLHLIIHSELKDELPFILTKAYDNSSVEQRNTLLFDYKASPFKPYRLTLQSGRIIEVRSKIEYIIAKTFDELGVKFDYEPEEFLKYGVKPDFKLFINDKVYYLEHLGGIKSPSYKERWLRKFEIYKKLGIADNLITTSESEEGTIIEENIKRIINDIASNSLNRTEGSFSYYHYYI
ncbi:MAG: AAA family ATPase, partial [Candidatus Baldrarchaeia archaeon]